MTRRISLAHLSAIDLPPPDLIEAAARAGFDSVGLRLIRVTDTTPGYPLMDDPSALRATCMRLRDTGVAVNDIEFIKINPLTEVAALRPFLDAGAEMGAREVICAPYDTDLNRLSETLGALSEQAKTRGLGVSLEFFPWTVVPDLETAYRIATVAGPDVAILIDALHFDRSHSKISQLRKIPGDRLRLAHLCDAPVRQNYSMENLLHTARAERLPPGEGQIELTGLLQALPNDLPVAVEVPMTARTAAEGHDTVLAHIMTATRRVLSAAQAL